MPGNTVERDLALRLEALRKDVGDTVPVEQVGVIVRSLLAGLAAPPDDAEFKLFHELDALAGHGRSVVEFAEFRNFSEPDLGLRRASQSMLWPLKTLRPQGRPR